MKLTKIRRTAYVASLLQLFLVLEASPQSLYLERGSSGVEMGAGIGLNDDFAGFTVDFGYSLAGLVDFGFAFGKSYMLDEPDDAEEMAVTHFAPSMGFLAIKQSDYVPISLGLGASYSKSKWGGDDFDRDDVDLTTSIWTISGSIYSNIELDNGTVFRPGIGVAHSTGKFQMEAFGEKVESENSSTNFTLKPSFDFKMKDGGFLYLTPQLLMGESETTFSFSVGMVFETNSPNRKRRSPRREPANTPRPWYGTPPGSPDPPPLSPEPTTVREPKAASEDLGRIGAEEIQAIKGKVSPLQSVGADNLAYDQLKTISRIFKVPLSIINQFRWGKAMAPVGHPHHKTIYFTIEYGDDTFAARETIRIDSDGNITERTKE